MQTTIKFNPFPHIEPEDVCIYIVLFDTGLTGSYWWDGEMFTSNPGTIDSSYGNVIGWAEFPEVEIWPAPDYSGLYENELLSQYYSEWESIDGINQHRDGLTFNQWLNRKFYRSSGGK